MLESVLVKDENVGESGADEVKESTEYPGDWSETEIRNEVRNTRRGGSWETYHTIRKRLTPCLYILSRGNELLYAQCVGSKLRIWEAGSKIYLY